VEVDGGCVVVEGGAPNPIQPQSPEVIDLIPRSFIFTKRISTLKLYLLDEDLVLYQPLKFCVIISANLYFFLPTDEYFGVLLSSTSSLPILPSIVQKVSFASSTHTTIPV